MPGPPPTPTHLKLLRGNPGHQKLRPEPEQAPGVPEPPPFITGYAADEWWTVAVELHRLRILTKVDVPALAPPIAIPMDSGGRPPRRSRGWADCDENMHGLLIKTNNGNARRNTLVKIAADAAEDMLPVRDRPMTFCLTRRLIPFWDFGLIPLRVRRSSDGRKTSRTVRRFQKPSAASSSSG
jgi:hypothetical protein